MCVYVSQFMLYMNIVCNYVCMYVCMYISIFMYVFRKLNCCNYFKICIVIVGYYSGCVSVPDYIE